MCNALKDGRAIAGLVLVALPLVLCSVAWAHITLETSLNLLWVSLAFGAFAQWVADRRRRAQPSGLVSLIFVLSLLFPVISANDDLAQLDLINDAKTSQSIARSLRNDKQLRGSAGLLGSPAVLALKVPSFLPFTSEFVFEPAPAASVAIAGDATGNHSPPFC